MFFTSIRKYSVSRLKLPFLNYIPSVRVRFRLIVAWNIQTVVVFKLLSVCWYSCCPCCYWLLWLAFLCSFYVFQSWRVLFLLLFLKHIVCQRYLWDVRHYASLSLFLFSGPFDEVLPSSTSRFIPSILQWGQLLYFWWDFCYIVWVRVIFSSSWDTLLNFSFISSCLMVSASNIPKYCKFPFLRVFRFFLDMVDLFLLSCVFCWFSLLAWHIFLCKIPSLYPECIFSHCIFSSASNSYSFLANSLMSFMYIRW